MSIPDALPAARTPDAAAAPALRWGVLGTAWIAERCIRSVQRHTRQQFTAMDPETPAAQPTSPPGSACRGTSRSWSCGW